MDIISQLFFQIVPFLALITVLITVHELGHYLVARFYGVAIQTFSIGFGKVLWSKVDKKGVTWQICLLPLGGYVRMASLDLLEYKLKEGHIDAARFAQLKSKTMEGQHTLGRILIAFAGPFANILLALVMLTGLFMYGGYARKVTCVVPGSPAAQAGVVQGDIISQVGASGLPMPVSDAPWRIHRGGQLIAVTMEPKVIDFSACDVQATTKGQKKIGVLLKESVSRDFALNFNDSLTKSLILIKESFGQFFAIFPRIFTQKDARENVGSIISVQQTMASISSVSIWNSMLFSAFLSINLAALNLLPIPVLDGGHIVIALVEGIMRKRLSQKIRSIIFIFGLAFIIFLFMFIVNLDIIRFISR